MPLLDRLDLEEIFNDNFYWQRQLGTMFYLWDMLTILYFSFKHKDLTILDY